MMLTHQPGLAQVGGKEEESKDYHPDKYQSEYNTDNAACFFMHYFI
jgi:hypothetical protein